MMRAMVFLAVFFSALMAFGVEPCVFETEFPLADSSRWMKVKSLENFAAGKPLNITGPWSLSSAKFFGDGREWSIPEWYALGRDACDGIYLREEVTSHGKKWEEAGLRTEIRRIKSGFEVTVEATLYNPKGNHDKLVTLFFEVLSADGEKIATGSRVQKAPDNAKSGNNADAVFLLSPEEIQRVARLRLTMTTKDY
jgi:hypothetical protein